MGLFPFHGWLPDAYTYASNTTTALIAPIMTKVAIYSMIRIFFWVFGARWLESLHIFTLLKILGGLGMICGALMAFKQTQIKRMLAYSSISHIGFISLAIGIHTPAALAAALLHIMNHAIMKACLFLGFGGLMDKHNIVEIKDLYKVRGKTPWTFAWITIASCSMIGLPPFAGFFSKFYVVLAAFAAHQWYIAALILFSGLLSALYFFKIIEQMFFQPNTDHKVIDEVSPWIVISTGLLSVILVVSGLIMPVLFGWFKQYIFTGIL